MRCRDGGGSTYIGEFGWFEEMKEIEQFFEGVLKWCAGEQNPMGYL